jgi:hypothetical protein
MIPRPCATILFYLTVSGLSLDSISSFLLDPSTSRSMSRAHTTTYSLLVLTKQHSVPTSLFAKKVRKNSSSSDSDNSKSGFGSPNTAAASSLQGKIRAVSGKSAGAGEKPHDVYVRSPDNSRTTFWFVGKIARDTSVTVVPTPTQAILSQKRIILEYAKQRLRPQNFGGKYAATLELWLAPADSEMNVVQNKVSLERVMGSAADLTDDFSVLTVGFNPEIYIGDELTKGGLRVERDEEGRPIKSEFEVNQSA